MAGLRTRLIQVSTTCWDPEIIKLSHLTPAATSPPAPTAWSPGPTLER